MPGRSFTFDNGALTPHRYRLLHLFGEGLAMQSDLFCQNERLAHEQNFLTTGMM
jgi:hypothetical protein